MTKTVTESIRIAPDTKQLLLDLKLYPRDTFNDVISRLITKSIALDNQ